MGYSAGMNKLTNTYLNAVDSLLAIHIKRPMTPEDWHMITSNLVDAVRALNQSVKEVPQPEKLPCKPLNLDDLKNAVDSMIGWNPKPDMNPLTEPDQFWVIGDFEISRRK